MQLQIIIATATTTLLSSYVASQPAAAPNESSLTLVEDGAPVSTIVVSDDASDKTLTAARELQHYIEKISGAKLPIVTDEQNTTGTLIMVGKSRLADKMDVDIPSGLTNARRDEGFVIVCKSDRLLLAGNDEGPYHGTEYAVYDFLERLSVRWYMPGEFGDIAPEQSTIRFSEMEIRETPDFVMRNWWLHTTEEMGELERRWKIRNKMNPESMFAIPGDSSARNIVDAGLFEQHPEYFAMNADGSRNPHLPNLSHPKAVEIAANIIKESLRNSPGANSFGFAPDDGMPVDFDPDTMKRNQRFVDLLGRPGVPAELSISEEWLTFVNNVTALVREEFPDVYIATNGYANRNIPPQGVELNDHLVVMFAAIWSDTLHAYDDPKSWQAVRQGQMLKEWASRCENVWIYGYNYVNLVSALTPVPRVRKLAREFPLMKKWGVMGFLDETRNVWAECGITTRYVRAKLEWDADADVEAILNDFYSNWYGKAATPARKFWDALENAVESTPMLGHEDRIMPYVYSDALIAQLDEEIEKTERLAETERTKLHVKADRLILEHLRSYMAMRNAEFDGKFDDAAKHAQEMLELRKPLHEINSFFIMPHEEGYQTGIWYWKVKDRKEYYQSLADKMSHATGELVAMLPKEARFSVDPRDEGRFAGWYAKDFDDSRWETPLTTKPFYAQGHMDESGFPYLGNIWYRIEVDVPADVAGKKVFLYAPIVETEAWLWVNGQYIGRRPYMEAYIRPAQLELEVTDALRPGETNQFTLRVNTSLNPAQAASGLMSRLFLYAPIQ